MEMKVLLNHFKAIKTAIEQLGDAEAYLNLCTFIAEVRIGKRLFKLYPTFMQVEGSGRTVYLRQFTPEVTSFAGWRPYRYDRVVPSLGKKKTFKSFLVEHGFRTPASGANVTDRHDYIVKADISSFGAGIRGPFRSGYVDLLARDDEFYEQFISGDIVKVYFHNADPLAMELKPVPSVTGDGVSTVRELADKRFHRRHLSFDLDLVWGEVRQMIGYSGYTLSDVLPRGETVPIDFRFGSPFLSMEETEDIAPVVNEMGCDCLPALGVAIMNSVPSVWREIALYSVDAMRDGDGNLWFLEVNFFPFMHPIVYPAMLKTLAALPLSPAPKEPVEYGV